MENADETSFPILGANDGSSAIWKTPLNLNLNLTSTSTLDRSYTLALNR